MTRIIPFVVVTIITPLFLTLGVLGCGDITQYKRIGDTNFYLVETLAESPAGIPLSNLYYSINPRKDGFSGVNQEGFPSTIFWNDQFIVTKCTNQDGKEIINYCIIKFSNTTHSDPESNYELHEYATQADYEDALIDFGILDSEMNQTDNIIPWSLHL